MELDAALEFFKSSYSSLHDSLKVLLPEYTEFYDHFFMTEFLKHTEDHKICIFLRNRIDTQIELDHSISNILNILNLIVNNQNILLDLRVGKSFSEIFENNLSTLQALKEFSFEIKLNYNIETLKTLYEENVSDNDKQNSKFLIISNIIHNLICHDNASLIIKTSPEKLFNRFAEEILNIPLSFVKEMINQYMELLPDKSIISNLNKIRIHLNAYDIYSSLTLDIHGLFK